jgi:orotidine-5'-phosphate decarboxylase
MPLTFAERLARAQQASGSLVCIGLDPDPAKLPQDLRGAAEDRSAPERGGAPERRGAPDPFGSAPPLYAFNRRIVDATAGIAAAYKPQIAFYSALGAEDQLVASIRYIRERAPTALVILDAKRGDIGNTAEAYAREAFDRYGADAVTVNPYMGEDSLRPFLARPDRGAILLCRTSNPGARDFQDLLVDGLPLYRRVAQRAAGQWNAHGNLMLVVGATFPREMAELRQAHPEVSFLVPGIGAQGGDLDATLAAGLDAHGAGLLISASRSIIYAGGGAAGAIREAAAQLRTAIEHGRIKTRS